MNKSVILTAAAAVGLLAGVGGMAVAQPRPSNPLEDFLGRIGRDNPNQALGCNVIKRIDRRGDIVYLQMTCRAYGRGR